MKKLIVVLMGGLSDERQISFLSGKACSKALKRKGYKEGKLGFLIALLAGLFPLISFLRAKIKKENNLQ